MTPGKTTTPVSTTSVYGSPIPNLGPFLYFLSPRVQHSEVSQTTGIFSVETVLFRIGTSSLDTLGTSGRVSTG